MLTSVEDLKLRRMFRLQPPGGAISLLGQKRLRSQDFTYQDYKRVETLI